MTYALTPLAGVNLAENSATQKHVLGQTVMGSDGAVWMYVTADGTLAAGDLVIIDEAFDATPVTTTLSANCAGSIGAAQAAITDNYYGWVIVGPGPLEFKLAAGGLLNTKVYTHTGAGIASGTSTGDLIEGLRADESAGASATTVVSGFAVQRLTVNSSIKG